MADLILGFVANITGAQAAFVQLGRTILDFSKDALKAFGEQEKADKRLSNALRQLGYDAQLLTPILKGQAEEFMRLTGVQDDTVEQMQALMLSFGAAPAQIRATTQAVLNYAATTGDDAVGATKMLMKSVDDGTGKLGRMGITFQTTGDRAQDLSKAAEAINAQFGGAAASQLEGYTGATTRLSNAWSELLEKVGKGLAPAVGAASTGIAWAFEQFTKEAPLESHLTQFEKQEKRLRHILTSPGLGPERARYEKELETLLKRRTDLVAKAAQEEAAQVDKKLQAATRFGPFPTEHELTQLKADAERARKEAEAAAKQEAEARRRYWTQLTDEHGVFLAGLDELERAHLAKMTSEQVKAYHDALSDSVQADHEASNTHAEQVRKRAEERQKAFEAVMDKHSIFINSMQAEERAFFDEMNAEQLEAWADAFETADTQERQNAEEHNRDLRQRAKDDAKALADQQEAWRDAGVQLGMSFANALSGQLDRLRAGGDIDASAMMIDVITGLASAGAIAYGQQWAVPLIGAGGGLLKSATATPSSGRRHHSGGVVRPLEFHDGGEVPAILQAGEVVWSRGDVARYGGAGAVDRMRQTAPSSTHLTIQAIDSQSFRELMTDRGGRAFVQAVRTGRGMLPALMRR